MQERHTLGNVVSINVYDKNIYSTPAHALKPLKQFQYKRNQNIVSFINSQHLQYTSISLNPTIPVEDIADAIEHRAYEILQLDISKEYLIAYYNTHMHTHNDTKEFDVFVVPVHTITDTFDRLNKKVRHIDAIYANVLLFETLYSQGLIAKNQTHLFFYTAKDDAFLALYHEGRLLFFNTLKLCLQTLHELFVSFLGENVSYEDFLHHMSRMPLKSENALYKSATYKLYEHIAKVLHSNVGSLLQTYTTLEMNSFYIGSSSPLFGLVEYVQTANNTPCKPMHFYKESSANSIDPMHQLMQLNASKSDSINAHINFTLYEKSYSERKGFGIKFLSALAASVILAFSYPLYHVAYAYYVQYTAQNSQKNYAIMHDKRIVQQKQVDKLLDKQKVLKQELAHAQTQHEQTKNYLDKIYKKRVNYPMKARHIALLTAMLNTHEIALSTLHFTHDETHDFFVLNVHANSTHAITKAIEMLTQSDTVSYEVHAQSITFDAKTKQYISTLKVVLL